MNLWDILILLAVAGLVYLAVRAMRSGKSRCSCGCDSCTLCADKQSCSRGKS